MESSNVYIAKTLQGLEPLLANELRALGATNVVEECRMVRFEGDKRMLYLANFHSRTALRILKPVLSFQAQDADELYEQALAYDWSSLLAVTQHFAIDSVVNSEEFNNSRYATYRLKDAIVDKFKQTCGRRPFVDPTNPEVRFHLHIKGQTCDILLDSSGESLHKRGYRVAQDVAPLNEVLAAGMILHSGWNGEVPFLDPMCGSGTILIEAALIAAGIAPGIFRKQFAFENWNDFDPDLMAEIYNDDSRERECETLILGTDISAKALESAEANINSAGLGKLIKLKKDSVFEYHPPMIPGIVVTNPPYGERLKQFQLDRFYTQLGDVFKSRYEGWDVWILSGNRAAMKSFGLHPSRTITLYNGPIECKYQRFLMYAGSLKGRNEEE
ncbi:MAG: THUMP domain-containing class I SAM-dependent RNA methyltransferase [Bacteroides sp.]